MEGYKLRQSDGAFIYAVGDSLCDIKRVIFYSIIHQDLRKFAPNSYMSLTSDEFVVEYEFRPGLFNHLYDMINDVDQDLTMEEYEQQLDAVFGGKE